MTYIGSSLDTIGQNMARTSMHGKDNQRLAVAQLLQALMQREQQAQQQQQFQQEMQYRQSGQGQDNAYKQALLGLQRQQQEFAQNGYTPAQVWEQQFREKELAQRPELYKLQAGNMNGSAMAALINQLGIGSRDSQVSQEYYDKEVADSTGKANEYSTIARQFPAQAAAQAKKEARWTWRGQDAIDEAAKAKQAQLLKELLDVLRTDTRPGTISPDATGTNFVPVLPQRRGQQQMQIPPQLLNSIQGVGPSQLQSSQADPTTNGMPPDMGALLQALSGSGISPVQRAVQQPAMRDPSSGAAGSPAMALRSEVQRLQQMYANGQLDKAGYNRARAELDAKYGIR